MSTKLENTLLFVIDQTNKMARHYSQREFDLLSIDIKVEQWVLLKVIEEKKTLTQNELAISTFRDPAAITRSLDILQKKRLIVRQPIANNRRQYNIKLTKEGDYFVLQNMSLINALRNKSVSGFTKAEVEQLMQMLKRVQNNLK